jgi:hypothetical protein
MGLEAQPPDDLLERAVVALGGNGLRRDGNLGGVGNVLAVDAPQLERLVQL